MAFQDNGCRILRRTKKDTKVHERKALPSPCTFVSVLVQNTWQMKLSRFFHYWGKGGGAFFHHFPSDFEFFQLLLARQVEHEIEHEFFENHAKTAGAYLAGHRLARYGAESFVGELEPHVFEFKETLVLLDDGVLWTGQDFDERELVEVFEHADNWQAANEFGNQSKLDKVLGLNFLQQFLGALL